MNTEFINGIDAAIQIIEKYKKNNLVVELIIRELKQLKKNEQQRRSY